MDVDLNFKLDALNPRINLQIVNHPISESTRRLSAGLKIAAPAHRPGAAQSNQTDIQMAVQSIRSIASAANVGGREAAVTEESLQSSIHLLNTAVANLTASAASIQDVDIASESANRTRLQMIRQTSLPPLNKDGLQSCLILELLK